MISSGRSFKDQLLRFVSRVLSEPFRRPRTLASTRNEPTWRTTPPIRLGVDRARRLDLAAGRLLDLADDPARLLVGELDRGRQLDGRAGPARAATRRSNSRAISSTSPARPFSASRQQEVADESWAPREIAVERRAPSRAGRAAGCGAARAAPAPRARRRRSRRGPRCTRSSRSPAPWRRRRARAA